jgi:hypothetical protein
MLAIVAHPLPLALLALAEYQATPPPLMAMMAMMTMMTTMACA